MEKDLPELVHDCFEILEPEGWLLVSCNYAEWGSKDLRRESERAMGDRQAQFELGIMPPEFTAASVSWRVYR